MGMIPECTSLPRHIESIREVTARRDSALRNTVGAVHPASISLVNAMPVYSRTCIGHEVVDSNAEHISCVGLDERPWRLAIHENHGFFKPIWGIVLACEIEHVFASGGFTRNHEASLQIQLLGLCGIDLYGEVISLSLVPVSVISIIKDGR